MSNIITITDQLKTAHPGAMIGLLEISGVDNSLPAPALDERKREVEALLRQRYAGFSRQDFLKIPIMAAYDRYYRRFDKTYHVLQQVESIALKGKSLPNVSALVDANFSAEVETLVLTAGHDVDKLGRDICMDVARAEDVMVQMNGAVKALRAGDMVMRDSGQVVCTVIYGQDNISPISNATTHALYVAYAPLDVQEQQVESQLRKIEENIRLLCPNATTEQLMIIHSSQG